MMRLLSTIVVLGTTIFLLAFHHKPPSSWLVKEVGGGKYSREIEAIIPSNPTEVKSRWVQHKNQIAEKIGPIDPGSSKESALWENSAHSIEDLLKDAKQAAPLFRLGCLQIAKETRSEPFFGPGGREIVKSEKSLTRKVLDDSAKAGISQEQATLKIRDALRGTLIADRPEQVSLIAAKIQEFVNRQGGEVIFKNFWNEEREDGYVGVHAKILFPFHIAQEGESIKKIVIAEVQIHLRSIMDGTKRSAKEREHKIYEKIRKEDADPDAIASASMFLYLSGMVS